jgi:serine protease
VTHMYRSPGAYTVTVGASDVLGNSAQESVGVFVEPARAVRNRARPSVAGRPRVGGVLTCLGGRWSGSPPKRFAYRWLRDGRSIAGATRRRYLVKRRDAGALLACRVQVSNTAGTRLATSRAVRIAA